MTELGAPLDLLAHWQYRATCLQREIYKTEETLSKIGRPVPQRLRNAGVSEDPLAHERPGIEHQLLCEQWLHAEAEFWSYRLDLEVRHNWTERVERRLDMLAQQWAIKGETKVVDKRRPGDTCCGGGGNWGHEWNCKVLKDG